MTKNQVKVIIADDSPEYIEGLELMFSTSDKYKVIDILSNGLELVNSSHLAEADIVLTDIEMPEMNGIQAAKKINFRFPNIPIVAVTMYKDKIYLEEIICAGFKGFIYKPDLADRLFEVLENVLNNKFSFTTTELKTKQ